MKMLDDVCEMFRGKLLEINSRSKHLQQSIEEFAATGLFLPAIMVNTRLLSIGEQILLRSGSLMAEHNGKGWVYVMKSDVLLELHWAQDEYALKSKDNLKKRGILVLTPVEITELIAELSKKVNSGIFAEAVDWINRYEPFFTNY